MATPDCDDTDNQHFVTEIDYNEIQRLEAVGEGSFGVVYKGIWRETYVAVKNITREEEKKAFTIEVRQLSRVNHENIVKLYGACTRGPITCLVMEYAEGGSLFNVLHCTNRIHYTLAHAMSWVYQCACGVEYLHAMKPKALIHRDLKPPNLLLIGGGTLLKICDFGTAADKSTYMTNNKGSAAWMAPEVFSSSNYTEKCDVFSWGIILWEVLSRKKPFHNIGSSAFSIMWAVHKGIRPPLMRTCPAVIEDLMVQCWDHDASKRPSMAEIVMKMKRICSVLPGAEKPIQTIVDYYEEDEETFYYDNENENTYSGQFPENTNGDNVVKTLPQPSLEMTKQLNVEVDPNAWELDNEENFADMRLRTMPGFDRMVPRNSGSKNATTVQAGIQSTTTVPDGGTRAEPNIDGMYLLLDQHLRPATPDNDDPNSMALFEEHKQLAQEYLKVQTEMALLSQRKNQLMAAQTEEQQRQRENLRQLQNEKESLILVRELLKKQKELAAAASAAGGSRNSGDSWVVVPHDDNN